MELLTSSISPVGDWMEIYELSIQRWIETYYNRRRRNTANELNLPPLVKRARFADRPFAA